MTSPRTEVRIRMGKLFDGLPVDGVPHEPSVTIPEICFGIRMALNGASDPWDDELIKDTYQLLQDVLTTWEPSVHDDLSAKMDDAVKDLVMATLRYVAANVPALAERAMIWYVRIKTQTNGDFSACVEAKTEDEARERAIQQVRDKYVPGLAWAYTELLEPLP